MPGPHPDALHATIEYQTGVPSAGALTSVKIGEERFAISTKVPLWPVSERRNEYRP